MGILLHQTILLLTMRLCSLGGCMQTGIIGGHEVVPHSRPYMAYLRMRIYNHSRPVVKLCDGFLVREDFVMTAAHCQAINIKVYLGIHNTSRINTYIYAAKQFPHPEYDESTYMNDIMLLKLIKKATLRQEVALIDLPKTRNEAIPTKCLITGWGREDFSKAKLSPVLKELNVTITNSKGCPRDDICTEGTEGPGNGDSGGPLVCGNVAHGVVSHYEKNPTEENAHFMYTRITHYLPWINKVMAG